MFPITVTVHNAGQLHAVLKALQPHLSRSDFVDPAIAAAYAEVHQTVARQTLADIQAAASVAATPLPPIEAPAVETADQPKPAGEWTWPGNAEDRQAAEPVTQPQEVAAAPVDPPAPTPAATAAGKPARGRRTAAAAAETAAHEKTAAESSPTAASAVTESPASTAATDAAAPAVTYDEHVKPAILRLVKERGRAAATDLLAEFKAANGPALKPEQYADFVARAAELLEEVPA